MYEKKVPYVKFLVYFMFSVTAFSKHEKEKYDFAVADGLRLS